MSEKHIVTEIYPENGPVQVAYGRVNGVWTTWFVRDGIPNEESQYPMSDQQRAASMFKDFSRLLKNYYYYEGEVSDGSKS